jgi:hypothetical protein
VELVRAEILALEPVENCRIGFGNYGYGDGGRIVCTSPGTSSLYAQDHQYLRLSELQYGAREFKTDTAGGPTFELGDTAWLPASAWADPEPKPYVPSAYEFAIGPANDVPAMLEYLPSEAAELLTRSTECADGGQSSACFEVRTEEARQILETLGIAPLRNAQVGQFGRYRVTLVPYLPHGRAVWCCGG